LDNFEWPHLRNGSRSTYIARIARIAQLSCMFIGLVDRVQNNRMFMCAISSLMFMIEFTDRKRWV